MSLTDGATRKSLFIQVKSYNPGLLSAHLEHVRLHHKDPLRDDYIYNVVLDEIGDEDGVLSPNLAIIRPYLPGGAKPTFDNVFVGSTYIPWGGPGSPYFEGMQDPGHRWRNLEAQNKLWGAFRTTYPNVPAHAYINHEGVLDWLDHEYTRACYEAYLVQSCRDANDAFPAAAVMWAPAIWKGYALSAAEERAIRVTFSNIPVWSGTRGVTWLHFQDCLGRGWASTTLEDVRQWYYELKGAYSWDSLRVDMEFFKTTPQGLVPEDPSVIAYRENWYQSRGIPVGASWELRWWMANHIDV